MRHALVLAIVSGGVAAPATAAVPVWERYTALMPCHAFATCASVVLQSIHTPTTSRIAITISNPHNLTGSLLGSGGYHLNTWTCTDPTLTFNDPECERDYGVVNRVTFRRVGINTTGPVRSVGMDVWFPDIYFNLALDYTSNGGDFFGCGMTQPFDPAAPESAYYSICAEEGFGGSVTIFYDFNGRWALPDFTYVDLASPGIPAFGGLGRSVLCTAAVPCVHEVVPEPKAWALMGTGLVGMALVTWRRRRAAKA